MDVKYLTQTTILYIEDDEGIRDGYIRALRRVCKRVYIAKNGLEGLEVYEKNRPDIIVSDIKMPYKDGIEMAKMIKKIDQNQIIVFTTAYSETNYTLKALELQVDGYLIKPVDKRKLILKLDTLAKNIVMEKENRKKTKILQTILDSQMEYLFLSDFKTLDFSSSSFFRLVKCKNSQDFSKKYATILDLFIKEEGYLYSEKRDDFLYKYNRADKGRKIVLIDTQEGVKSFYIKISPIEVDENTLYIFSLIDITYFQEEKLKAEYIATHDELTGSFNRVKFNTLFEIEYQRAVRYKRPLSLAVMDIDFFKKVNDTYGHLKGDEVLKELVLLCEKSIRKTDFFARWGGEEFSILMSETSLSEARDVCEQLRKEIEKTKFIKFLSITVSIGVAQLYFDETKEDFFKRADDALYEAKSSGRNKVLSKQ